MAQMPGVKDLMQSWGGVPIIAWAGIAAIALYLLNKLRSGSSASGANAASMAGTSVINAPSTATSPAVAWSMGHVIPQGLPSNQLTPNEGPGTAAIFNTSSGYQYGQNGVSPNA